MALQKYVPSGDSASASIKPLSFFSKAQESAQHADPETSNSMEPDVDIDLREVYFLIMHFLSSGPCHRTYGQLWNELLEHQLLPRRYHAWYSRNGAHCGDENDNGLSFPLSYNKLVERFPHVEKDHLVKLLKQLILTAAPPSHGMSGGNAPNAADVPTLLGTGSFSLLSEDRDEGCTEVRHPPAHLRWPHMKANQVHGLSLREIGGGFTRHHRAPSIRAACYAIAKPLTMVQKMQNIKKLRGHRSAVYCAIFDRSGRYVITGSDDRLVKIWSMETAFCLASCRGHEGDITDLAVSSNNALVASSSNDCIIRVWRLPDGLPISVLKGHAGAVTAIAFSPRPSSIYQILSSSDDGTCRIWDARNSQFSPRIYVPRPSVSVAGKNNGPSSSTGPQSHQIFCCAFNANGTIFVTGSSDNLARVWNASKLNSDEADQPNHEIDVLSGHENDVNYVQFSGCAVASRFSMADTSKEENIPKFKNTWFNDDNIVTCSRDGSAIIWIPRSRRSHGKLGRWVRAYHLKVPPPHMPPRPTRGGPRQRILPTPRGVNMIVWSLDNRFVLTAIMDCRICVWNASDGSLVHSLTGHTDSTYVLDVHPFNPRIAMSAGYDGKTIVWDIWEGIPIRIYEISRFKLVDGKFSSDGTSIILSDDVGQLYILNTGQGESQKDAKYDQFYLGDYRPLILDTHGNVLDQETQNVPYRRNMQDFLCDSGLIPYTEPYQSMFQRRRLGALGFDWHPPTLRLSVGPDLSLDADYQMLPLADLDVLIDPLPELTYAMDWEPENEVQSDDNDSEYNVAEDYSTGAEQGNLSSNPSGDLVGSAEDSGVEETQEGDRRRSNRKKKKADVGVMTSSGRRVKRRNHDECDGNSFRRKRIRKSRNGQKVSKRKSTTSKSLRPQRAAARNALTLFSKITGMSTDGEDDDSSEGGTLESESSLQDSNVESYETDKSLQNEQSKHLKGKELFWDESEDVIRTHELPESHLNAGNRRRLVLRLPVLDSNKIVPMQSKIPECNNCADLVGSSSKTLVTEVNSNHTSSQDPDHPSGDANCSTIERSKTVKLEKTENHFDLSDGYKNGKIRWGGVKARSSKRQRMGEGLLSVACTGPRVCFDGYSERENNVNGYLKPEKDYGTNSHCLENQNHGDKMDKVARMNGQLCGGATPENLDFGANGKDSIVCRVYDKSPNWDQISVNDTTAPSPYCENGIDHPPELKDSLIPISTKLRIRSKRTSRNPLSPSKWKIKSSSENQINGGVDILYASPSDIKQNPVTEVSDSNGTNRLTSNHGDDELQESDAQIDKESNLHDSLVLHSRSNKMHNAVHKRSKSHKGRTNSDGDADDIGEGTSNVSNHNLEAGLDLHFGARRTRSMGLKVIAHEVNNACNNMRLGQGDESEDTCKIARNGSISRCQLPHEEWGSSSRTTIGLRSTRNRKGSYYVYDNNPMDRKKSHQSARKTSWLMLMMHEEGSHYIPQQGDDVVYLRQGHQEYLSHSGSREMGPWTSLTGNIQAVEFCKVINLEYSTLPGSGDSCCKMTLQFVDPTSSVFHKSFKFTLPEVTGFPDFLVERTRFDAAMKRNWTVRDKCKVWWKNEGEEDGSWWAGRVLQVKPKSSEFPESPWERYTFQYKTEPTETHLHSPWELYDAATQWEQPHINDEIKEKLLSAFDKLERSGNRLQDQYGVKKLKQVLQKSNFTNRFPVPLSLELIRSRLENNYYRSMEALKHDITVMLSNAESYFGKNEDLTLKIARLSGWFMRTLSSL